MGIHYDYKSTRGDKKLKKEAKRDAKRRNKKSKSITTPQQESDTHIPPIDQPITMDDLLMAQLEKDERDEKKKK
jgi:hypothetical protein